MAGEDRAFEQFLAEEHGDQRAVANSHSRPRLHAPLAGLADPPGAREAGHHLGGGQRAEHADERLGDPEVGVPLAGELVACVASVGEPVAEVVHPQSG